MPYKDYEKQKARARERYQEVKGQLSEFRKTHPGIISERNKAHYEKMSQEERLAKHKKFLEQHPRYRRDRLLQRYGLSREAFNAMLIGQGSVCAVCHQGNGASLQVDHNHKTGMVRGLLCFRCNAAAGLLSDQSERAQSLAEYLSRTDEEA